MIISHSSGICFKCDHCRLRILVTVEHIKVNTDWRQKYQYYKVKKNTERTLAGNQLNFPRLNEN